MVDAKKPCAQRLLKIKEAADCLSVTPKKLRDLVHAGELPVVQFGENARWLINTSDLDELISRYTQYKRTA